MIMQGSLFSSVSAKALISRLACRGLAYRRCWSRHHHAEKQPCFCAKGYGSTRAAAKTQPELCSQTLLQESPDPSKLAVRKCCSIQTKLALHSQHEFEVCH